MFTGTAKAQAALLPGQLAIPQRRASLRRKSLIVYGALILGTIGVAVFVFHQRMYLLGQFDRLQDAYTVETRLYKIDMTILNTIQAQVLGIESLGVELESTLMYDHLQLLREFFNNVIVRHVEQGPEVAALQTALQKAHEETTPESMAALKDAIKGLQKMIVGRLEESQAHRLMLATGFRNRADMVSLVALGMLLFGFAVLGIINALFFTRLTRDVQALTQRALQVAGGQSRERIPITRNDEVGDLIEAINRMADDLKERDRALEIERQKSFHREKMVAIGVLAAGIAHEIGNPIAAITGLVEELQDGCIGHRCDEGCMKTVLEQVSRLKKITREVSEFARPQHSTRELLDLNSMIHSTCNLMRYDKRWRGVDLKVDLDSNLPAVEGVPDQLMQVIMNLLVNAVDALEDVQGRTPQIRISTSVDTARNGVLLVIRDNGHGMDKETQQRAMEAFFTTKDVGKGTGLGLSLCHSIIAMHKGGEIQIESEPGVGTVIRIFLPLGGEGDQIGQQARHDGRYTNC